MKRQSLSGLLSTDPIDWQWATHPRLIFLRSQCFMSELPPCRGAINNNGALSLGSRRGLLAYVYSGVSLTKNALVVGIGSYIVRLSVCDLYGPTTSICDYWLHTGWILCEALNLGSVCSRQLHGNLGPCSPPLPTENFNSRIEVQLPV